VLKKLGFIVEQKKPSLPKPNKFGAIKTEFEGVVFHSKGEAQRYSELLFLEKIGQISDLKRQVKFKFEINETNLTYVDSNKEVSYIADFTYEKDGAYVVEDFKGFETEVFKIKWALMRRCYPDVSLVVSK